MTCPISVSQDMPIRKMSPLCLPTFIPDRLPEGWSTSGLAFDADRIRDLRCRSTDKWPDAGSIDSGVAGKKQVGILRSPTFEITTKQIHVRMKASANVTVQVIIDNYQMAPFSKLLFKGTSPQRQTDRHRKGSGYGRVWGAT